MSDLLRIYLDPDEIGKDGYPHAWHGKHLSDDLGIGVLTEYTTDAIKDLIREHAGHRCVRCGHPYEKGKHGRGEWTPCDGLCTHRGPTRVDPTSDWPFPQAHWRILTVHHLNGIKHDCRWFNLVALCQRCHLTIQGKVYMERPWNKPHKEWFRPYAAGYYASALLGEELNRVETEARLDELLALQETQSSLC